LRFVTFHKLPPVRLSFGQFQKLKYFSDLNQIIFIMCFQNGNTACPQETKCEICFEKSFASHYRAEFWSDKNELKPWQFKKQSTKKFWFKCDKSNHIFNNSSILDYK
jgi:hypothetical protein